MRIHPKPTPAASMRNAFLLAVALLGLWFILISILPESISDAPDGALEATTTTSQPGILSGACVHITGSVVPIRLLPLASPFIARSLTATISAERDRMAMIFGGRRESYVQARLGDLAEHSNVAAPPGPRISAGADRQITGAVRRSIPTCS